MICKAFAVYEFTQLFFSQLICGHLLLSLNLKLTSTRFMDSKDACYSNPLNYLLGEIVAPLIFKS